MDPLRVERIGDTVLTTAGILAVFEGNDVNVDSNGKIDDDDDDDDDISTSVVVETIL